MSGGGVSIDQLIQQAKGGGAPVPTQQTGGGAPPSGGGAGGKVSIDQLLQQAKGGAGVSGVSQAAAPASSAPKKPGLLSRIASDLKQGVAGVVHIPALALNDRQTFLESAVGKKGADFANSMVAPVGAGLLAGKSNANAQRAPGESLSGFTARKYPLLGGALVQGPVNLFEHAAHPTQAARDYSAHPVLGPLADLATLALFTGPAAATAEAGAEGAAEGAAASGTAEAASRAATLGKVARVAEGVHGGVEAAASGGLRPLLNGVGSVDRAGGADTVRLYRGIKMSKAGQFLNGAVDAKRAGQWFTNDQRMASAFSFSLSSVDDAPRVVYVDVPASQVRRLAAPGKPGEFLLPPELSAGAQTVPFRDGQHIFPPLPDTAVPGAPGRLRSLLDGVGPVPGLRAIPERAFGRLQEGSTGTFDRVAAKFAQPMHKVSAAILGGQSDEAAARGEQARLGKRLNGIISDPHEQAAAVAVGESVAPTLATLRAHLGADGFAKYVADRFKGSLSPEAANLAADVAEGKNPELAGRVDEFLRAYDEGRGGQGARTEAFMATPGHAWQGGYEPNPAAVDAAKAEATSGLPRLSKLADTARARADQASARAVEVAGREVPAPKVDVRAQRLVGALRAVDAARARAGVRAGAVGAAEDALVSKAEGGVPSLDEANADLERQVAGERKALRQQYVSEAGRGAVAAERDMAPFFSEGPLQRFNMAQQPDWYRNLPGRVRNALHSGLSMAESAGKSGLSAASKLGVGSEVGGIGPDEFIQAARRELPHMEGMSENQIADYFTKLYDRYAAMRKARFQPFAGLTPDHLRNVGIEDPYLEALLGDAPARDVAQHLADTYGGAAPATEASLAAARSAAVGEAGSKLVAAQQAAEDAHAGVQPGGVADARRQMLEQVAGEHGPDAARVAGKHFDALAAEAKVAPAEGAVPVARGRLTGLVLKQGEQVGAAQMRARVLGNVARSAEDRVGKMLSAGERAKVNAEAAVQNAPSRLRPVLAENRAAAHSLVGVVNDLRHRGLTEAARQAEDAIGTLPTDLKGLEAAGVDAPHFFHVQEGQPPKGGMFSRQVALPKPFTPGSEKLRTGSPVYDRTVTGQLRGGEELARANVRRATAEKIATMPGVAEHLGRGALEGVHNTEEAFAKGFVPWQPGSLFDKAGRVRPMSTLEDALGIEHPTVFLPKPVFDEFRNYFEPRRGQVLGAFLDPANRVRFMANLALKPAYIVGRVFGHGMLALAGTSDPVAFAGNLMDAWRQWKGSAEDVHQRFFPETPARLLHSQADTAEYARMVSDTAPSDTRLGRLAGKVPTGKLTDLGTAALRRPFQLGAFMDNMQRTAFYLTERSRVGDEAALESTLRATGEFDRATPMERDYVRRIIPFWQWHRELTRIAFHLAEDHPLRVAWTLHLANLASQPDGSMPDQFSQAFHAGPYAVDASYALPFNEVPSAFGGGVFGFGKIAGTVPQMAYASATGEKATTGRPFSGPPGSGQSRKPTAPSLLHQFAQTLPQQKVLSGLTGRDRFKRYDTGDLQVKAGKLVRNPTGKPLTALTGFLGFPTARVSDLQTAQQRADGAKAAADRTAATQQRKYKGRLKRLGG